MAQYRKLVVNFWLDPRVRELSPTQKVLFTYAITGLEACKVVNLSGIYEVHRGQLSSMTDIPIDTIEKDLRYFNKEKPMLLQFDENNHMLFVKSFYKYNSNYKSDISSLIVDFSDTFHKAPYFWAEFGQKYEERLNKILKVVEDQTHSTFINRLLNLKDEIVLPNFKFKPIFSENLNNQKSLQL